jgi:hypothetical protein
VTHKTHASEQSSKGWRFFRDRWLVQLDQAVQHSGQQPERCHYCVRQSAQCRSTYHRHLKTSGGERRAFLQHSHGH